MRVYSKAHRSSAVVLCFMFDFKDAHTLLYQFAFDKFTCIHCIVGSRRKHNGRSSICDSARRPRYNEQRRQAATFSISRNHTVEAAG